MWETSELRSHPLSQTIVFSGNQFAASLPASLPLVASMHSWCCAMQGWSQILVVGARNVETMTLMSH